MITRIIKSKDFTTIANDLLQDRRLSWKAKGLMAYVLSLPDDWQFSIDGLAVFSSDGKTVVRNALNELKEFGYLTVSKITPKDSKKGRFEYVYEFRETPKTRSGFLDVEILTQKNNTLKTSPIQKTKEQITKEQKTKDTKDIVDFLNFELGTRYKAESKELCEKISGRLTEGYTVEDFKTVIRNMKEEWGNDERMSKYLRPSTLFAPTHFPEYLNRKPQQKQGGYFGDDDLIEF